MTDTDSETVQHCDKYRRMSILYSSHCCRLSTCSKRLPILYNLSCFNLKLKVLWCLKDEDNGRAKVEMPHSVPFLHVHAISKRLLKELPNFVLSFDIGLKRLQGRGGGVTWSGTEVMCWQAQNHLPVVSSFK